MSLPLCQIFSDFSIAMPTPYSCDLRNEAESVLWHCGERGEKTQPALQNIIAEPKWNHPAPQHERGDTIGECWDRKKKCGDSRPRLPGGPRLSGPLEPYRIPTPPRPYPTPLTAESAHPRSPVACPRPWPSKRSGGRPDLWETFRAAVRREPRFPPSPA